MMKRVLLSLALIVASFLVTFGQTVLSAGDLAFVGYNTDAPEGGLTAGAFFLY